MLIKTTNKWDAIHAVINTWLKDTRRYCNVCFKDYHPEIGACCEAPQIGTNMDFCLAMINEIKSVRKTRMNDFSTNDTKSMRWGVSLPPDLLRTLDTYMKAHGQPKGLFQEKSDLHKFMRKFPQFCIPKKV